MGIYKTPLEMSINKVMPTIIIYQPNNLNPCFCKKPMKNLMANNATTKATILPIPNVIKFCLFVNISGCSVYVFNNL